MSNAPLILKNVSKRFAEKLAVNDVSFTINPGEIVGFLGPNGAGKTTTIRMALGLINPDEGEVSLFGQEPGDHSFGRVGFLPEERGLYKKQRARDSVAFLGRLNGMKGRDAYKVADEMLNKYGLAEARTKKNKDMSKGMAQKVQLLGVLANDPEFYILDEPFSGLDPVNQKILEDMVREIAKKGRTIIFSTHVMEHAERLCDRIILMGNGKKVFDGSTEEALTHAPKRLVIAAETDNLSDVVAPFCADMRQRDDGTLDLILTPKTDAQSVLEACVKKKIKLARFEPKRATLHEAFVAMVGKDVLADMEAGQ